MKPEDFERFGVSLAKLSPADRSAALDDLLVFGAVYIEERADGTARLINPAALKIVTMTQPAGGLQPVADALPEELGVSSSGCSVAASPGAGWIRCWLSSRGCRLGRGS